MQLLLPLLAFFANFYHSGRCQPLVTAGNSKCSYEENGYHLSWKYDKSTQMVMFDLTAESPDPNSDFWTGVGFGPSMSDMDFIGVFVRNGQIGIADTYTNQRAQPVPDTTTNVQILGFEYNNGTVTASFGRPLETTDDKDKSLDGCQNWNFPVSGGRIEGTGLNKHLGTPKNMEVCDVAKNCAGSDSVTDAVTTAAPSIEYEDEIGTTEKGETTGNNTVKGSDGPPDATVAPVEIFATGTVPAATTEPPQVDSVSFVATTEPPQVDSVSFVATTAPAPIDHPNTDSSTPCPGDHNDLIVCGPYFDEYFGRVDDWALLHKITPISQYFKGCRLIGEVNNVRNSCCKLYHEKCDKYLMDGNT